MFEADPRVVALLRESKDAEQHLLDVRDSLRRFHYKSDEEKLVMEAAEMQADLRVRLAHTNVNHYKYLGLFPGGV